MYTLKENNVIVSTNYIFTRYIHLTLHFCSRRLYYDLNLNPSGNRKNIYFEWKCEPNFSNMLYNMRNYTKMCCDYGTGFTLTLTLKR